MSSFFRNALFLAAVLPAAALPAEDLSQWAGFYTMYFNTTPTGANVDGDVRDFPLLVRLHDVFPFAQCMPGGQDIRFAKPDGTPLAYEIETWEPARGEAAFWVHMDTVYGNSDDQSIRLFWGKPGAPAVSNGYAVFDTAYGYGEVWHMGGEDTHNSAPGGQPAEPFNYDGDENTLGVGRSGRADSLDGKVTGDYLSIGDWYDTYNNGFTFSVWLYPTGAGAYQHILELGNGRGLDNIILQRENQTNDLSLLVYKDATVSQRRAKAKGALLLDQWQHFAVTVQGRYARIYRNGALVAYDSLDFGIPAVRRAYNYLGKSSWEGNAYFMGKIDEAWLSRKARSADWVKLAYANQMNNQTLIRYKKAEGCQSLFDAPRDTSLSEGSALELPGTADCASYFSWTLVSGPGPSILDPEVKTLQVYLPRVLSDVSLTYNFSAVFPDSTRSKSVRVSVKDVIPDPVFTFPSPVAWNGNDSLLLKPVISNLAAVKASRDSVLYYSWSMSGMGADTAWRPDGLMLRSAPYDGLLKVQLCLNNNGPTSCHSVDVQVDGSSAVRPGAARAAAAAPRPDRDALGRAGEEARRRAVKALFARKRARGR